MPVTTESRSAWWNREPVVRRFVSDLVAAGMAQLRPTGFTAPASPFERSVSLTDELGVDSLELTNLASALNEILHLHESGVEDRLLRRHRIGDWVAIAREGLAHYSSTMTFRTSGSMGMPRRHEHRVADLFAEASELAALVPGRKRVLSAVRSHHIYGFLFTIALPDVLGMPADAVLDIRPSLPSSLPARMREGDLVIGYPDFWRDVARASVRIPPDVVGVTSTAPCPDNVVRDIERLGLATLVQVYGSTETAGVGVRIRADTPFALMDRWQRYAGNAHELVTRNGAATITVPDVLEWIDDRHFRPMGRADDVVQVGGVNVSLSHVRQVLLKHPQVRDASVRVMSAELGDRLKAFIVPMDVTADPRVIHTALEGWIRQRLPALQRPRALSFGSTLPVNAVGKLVDWTVAPADPQLL